ncbi:MAG: phospholipid carrier-dependent glycosyltransferase [Patescibacteria group bacterium]
MNKTLLIIIILLAAFLRLYKLGSVPPSLYWDEASLGYNAYSILITARDEHGRFLPGTNFAAFGDYKPPGYIYATVPAIAAFGLNEFAIRFPSAFFGTLTVLLTYFLAKKLFEKESIALLATFFLAISPWHLQFSRGAFEANLGLFFSLLGIYLFLKFATEKAIYILPSALSFLAAMYTFTGQRLFVPFILIVLAWQFRQQILKNIKSVSAAILISAVLFWPLFIFVTQTIEGKLRFNEVTIFKDLEPIDRSNRYRERDDFSWYSDITHNRRFLYAREYLIHYFDAFEPSFLFTKGDANPRLSVQEVGELYYLDLFLILAGIYFLIAQKHKGAFLILGWLLVSPLGPATARETPHALRMIHILPTFQLLAAFGLVSLYQIIRLKKLFLVTCFLFLVAQFLFYLHIYYFHWPRIWSNQWQYGYKQLVYQINNLYDDADHIVVTKALGRPYIYFLLYRQVDPRDYLKTAKIVRDQFFFIDVNGFDKFIFTGSPADERPPGKTIYITEGASLPAGSQLLSTINQLDGKVVFRISTITN